MTLEQFLGSTIYN